MRILDFIVDKQTITKSPVGDFKGLVPGTKGYLKARFFFSPEWEGCTKVAGFSSGDIEYTPQVIGDDNSCDIPAEALKRPAFNVQVLGRKSGVTITTNKVSVTQNGGTV